MMKRWLILAILLIATSALAGPPKINGTTVSKIDGLAAAKCNGLAGGSSCGALIATISGGTNTIDVAANTNNELYMAFQFTANASGDAKTVYIYARDSGTPSTLPAYLYMYLCSDSSDSPVSIGSCTQSTTTNITDPGGTAIKLKYKFSGFSMASSSKYWVVLTSSYGSLNSSNYFMIQGNTTGTGLMKDSPNGTSYSQWDSTSNFNLEITSCDE